MYRAPNHLAQRLALRRVNGIERLMWRNAQGALLTWTGGCSQVAFGRDRCRPDPGRGRSFNKSSRGSRV